MQFQEIKNAKVVVASLQYVGTVDQGLTSHKNIRRLQRPSVLICSALIAKIKMIKTISRQFRNIHNF